MRLLPFLLFSYFSFFFKTFSIYIYGIECLVYLFTVKEVMFTLANGMKCELKWNVIIDDARKQAMGIGGNKRYVTRNEESFWEINSIAIHR